MLLKEFTCRNKFSYNFCMAFYIQKYKTIYMYIYLCIVFKANCFAIDIWKLLRNNPLGHRIAAFLFDEIALKLCFTHTETIQNYSSLTLALYREFLASSQHSRNSLRSVFCCCQSSSSCAFKFWESLKATKSISMKGIEQMKSLQILSLCFLRDRHYYRFFFSVFPYNTYYFSFINLFGCSIPLLADVLNPVYKVTYFKGWDIK